MTRAIASLLLTLLLLSCTGIAQAEAVSVITAEGNAELRSGDFDAAIEKFEAALSISKDPRIAYNKAIAHFRKGESDVARNLFGSVAASANPALAARARYNMGNVDYSDAIKLAEQDPPAAIGKLRSAISHYRAALATNPQDKDARANIELAGKLIRQLRQQQDQQNQDQQNQDQQQQDQQQQDQQQQDQQQQDQEQQDQEQQDQEQQDQQQQDQQQQDQQQQDQQQQDQQSQDQQQQQDQQQDQQQQDQQQQDQQQQDQQQQDQQQQDQQQQDQQQQDQQQQGENADREDQSESANEEPSSEDKPGEQPPEGELKPLNEQGEGEEQPGMEQSKARQKMTMEEARKMLQAVRDRDLRRRLEKLQRTRMRRIRVDKDW